MRPIPEKDVIYRRYRGDVMIFTNDLLFLFRYKWILVKNILLAGFGLIALVSGCAVTLMDIIHAYPVK